MKKLKRLKLNHLSFLTFFVVFLILLAFSLICFQLYRLQVSRAFSETAVSQKWKKIPPLRGNIYFKDKYGNLYLAATSYYLYTLYFYPPKSKNIELEINQISKFVHFEDINKIIEQAKNSKKSLVLAKNLTDQQKNKIEKLKLDSVFFEEKVVRDYPLQDTFATVLGFAKLNEDGVLQGEYGLEKYYDEVLKGETGYRTNFQIIKNPVKGADLVLNIDYYVQKKCEEILKSAIEKYKASGGLIVVSEVKTGNILAVAELPSYNPNKYFEQKDYSVFISRLSKVYEPGSVMKPFFYAGAFAEKLVTPTTTYNDLGYVILNNWKIENFDKKGRGVIDLKTALEQSLNTGSVYISQVLGKTRFLKYVEKFKLNIKPEIDFPVLEEPDFSNLYPPQGREVNFGTASFGQGVAVSPLNLIQGFDVFANNGKMMKLNLVNKIVYFDGTQKEITPKVIANVLDQYTLSQIIPILEGVVENQAKKAKIKGYGIGGKTGSALIPKAKETPEDPSGYTDQAITTFIGFFPIKDPKYLVLVRLDKPAPGLLSFGTAVPTFRYVAEFLINYYNIEPDKYYELSTIY